MCDFPQERLKWWALITTLNPRTILLLKHVLLYRKKYLRIRIPYPIYLDTYIIYFSINNQINIMPCMQFLKNNSLITQHNISTYMNKTFLTLNNLCKRLRRPLKKLSNIIYVYIARMYIIGFDSTRGFHDIYLCMNQRRCKYI